MTITDKQNDTDLINDIIQIGYQGLRVLYITHCDILNQVVFYFGE